MAEQTKIEWADATWNPWMGCKKVSAGCKLCYAERDSVRWGKKFTDIVKSKTKFTEPLKWARGNVLKDGAKIFTCSWSDWFIEEADQWRPEAWTTIKATPQFTYLILTKRPERILEHLPSDWGTGYKNVWLIVSAENQEMFDERWAILKNIPCVVRGLSCEPLLGKINIGNEKPDWIITGGESDKSNPRKSEMDWFRQLRDTCALLEIAYFHKQHGGTKKINDAWGGRELDGIVWNNFPSA